MRGGPLADRMQKGDYYKPNEVRSLMSWATEVVARNFELYPHLTGVTYSAVVDSIIEQTSVSLPIAITAPFVHHESYWKRACESRWKNVRPEEHGWSWKQAYMETHIQELIMKSEDEEHLASEILAAKYYLFFITVSQLPSHMNMRVLFLNAPTITGLAVTFGAKHLGSEYERSQFGMKLQDAANLCECVKTSLCLTSLFLTCNLLDDDLVKLLSLGLLSNKTITELNLSHNRIADAGAKKLAKYLFRTSVLVWLDLSDNLISEEGARYFSQALRNNKSLESFSIKHNRLSDKAGAKLLHGLEHNETLVSLNISANQLSTLSVNKLLDLLGPESHSAIRELDISCNMLYDAEVEEVIREDMLSALTALEALLTAHCRLVKLDLRNAGLPRSKR